MKRFFGLALVIILLLGVAGCFKKKNDHSNEGVCVLDNASVRAEPTKQGKWLSSLTLGETVQLEGGAQKDATDPKLEYLKVKLSDGTEGYVNAFCVDTGAYVGVIYNTAKVYKRPDLLSQSDQKMEVMEIVAVEEENGSFIRVTGENRWKNGWIQKEAISKDKQDIVTAVLLKKALRGKKSVTSEEMDQIIAKLPYPDNDFVHKTREKYGLSETATSDETATNQTPPTTDSKSTDNGNTQDNPSDQENSGD